MRDKPKLPFMYRFLKIFGKFKVHKTKFHFKEELKENAIIICNHNNSLGPLNWIFYFNHESDYWSDYRYYESLELSRETCYNDFINYGDGKRKAKLKAKISARCFSYAKNKAGHIIYVYNDMRFILTIKQSIKSYKEDKFVILFADDPSNVHTNDIKTFMPGAIYLAKTMLNEGIDPNIVLAHIDKKGKNIYVDKPVKFSTYNNLSDEELINLFKDRINNKLEEEFKK